MMSLLVDAAVGGRVLVGINHANNIEGGRGGIVESKVAAGKAGVYHLPTTKTATQVMDGHNEPGRNNAETRLRS